MNVFNKRGIIIVVVIGLAFAAAAATAAAALCSPRVGSSTSTGTLTVRSWTSMMDSSSSSSRPRSRPSAAAAASGLSRRGGGGTSLWVGRHGNGDGYYSHRRRRNAASSSSPSSSILTSSTTALWNSLFSSFRGDDVNADSPKHDDSSGVDGKKRKRHGVLTKSKSASARLLPFLSNSLRSSAFASTGTRSDSRSGAVATKRRRSHRHYASSTTSSSHSEINGSSLPNRNQYHHNHHDVLSSSTSSSFPSSFPSSSYLDQLSHLSSSSTQTGADEVTTLREENDILRQMVSELENENRRLHHNMRLHADRIVIERFEGERRDEHPWFEEEEEDEEEMDEEKGTVRKDAEARTTTMTMRPSADDTAIASPFATSSTSYKSTKEVTYDGEWCDELQDDGTCPIEPDVSFMDALRDRAYWLVGLLVLQSLSGIILAKNEELLQMHPVIVYFLTMLVGAGGNAGNQASVRVIRGLALGTLNERTQRQFLNREFKMACSLSSVLSLAGFARAAVFRTPFAETVAVTTALALIVFSSICLGAVLPLMLRKVGVDPAHSSTTIQVVMDILGVVLTVIVSTAILDSPVGKLLIAKLSW